ncbi:MAG: hypothetical protein ACYC5S_06960 [Thiobacillus sp.]
MGTLERPHRDFVVEAATACFTGHRRTTRKRAPRFNLAILHDPANPEPPSNARDAPLREGRG